MSIEPSVANILWNERRTFAAAILIALVCGATVTVVSPKTYAGDALLDVGDLPLESAQRAIDKTRTSAQWPVSAAYRAPSSYYIAIEGSTPSEVRSRLDQFTTTAIGEMQRLLEDSGRDAHLRLSSMHKQSAANEDQARAFARQVADELHSRIRQNADSQSELATSHVRNQKASDDLMHRLAAQIAVARKAAQAETARQSDVLQRLTSSRASLTERKSELSGHIERLIAESTSTRDSSPVSLLFTLQQRRELHDARNELRRIDEELNSTLSARLSDAKYALQVAQATVAAAERAQALLGRVPAGLDQNDTSLLLEVGLRPEDIRNASLGSAAGEQSLRQRQQELRGEAVVYADLKRLLAASPGDMSNVATVALALSRLGATHLAARADWAAGLGKSTADTDLEIDRLTQHLNRIRKPTLVWVPVVSETPVRPRLSWNLGLSAVVGLAAAALFVLLLRRPPALI